MRRVPSTDGVVVAIHELAGTAGRHQPLLLVGHATGFHGHAYLPIAKRLAPSIHSVAFDFRGHGDTPAPPDWNVDWARYGDDAVAAADAVAELPGAEGDHVRLKCAPEHEARTFEQGARQRTWDVLGDVPTPVIVVAGHVEEGRPSAIAGLVAEELPRGRLLVVDHLDHFGPFTDPGAVADIVRAAIEDDERAPADRPSSR
jgi:pimeloyl-ACP methyl ester carboxylesterase